MLPGKAGSASHPAPLDSRLFIEVAGGQPGCGSVLSAAVTEALLRAGGERLLLQGCVF